ncbi:hypothetical protein AVEN_41158-1 [Araneus ventricosus]|uniref:Uncharacterized protein n=1 Tax=Araneus ventricosus TaxID=182803 RepID=A0A4Y2LJH8_ARAVE|nr:hypothetical protein AVEN_41158-1 [Araneus ventricosus]
MAARNAFSKNLFLSSDNSQSQLSSHCSTLLHSVLKSSLLATARFLFQFLSEVPCEGTNFSEALMYAPPPLPLLSADVNNIQLIDIYFPSCWT